MKRYVYGASVLVIAIVSLLVAQNPVFRNPGALADGSTAVTQSTGDGSTKVASDQFVAQSLASINPAVSVQAATTSVLPTTPTYNNGTAGVGATLTAGSNGFLATIDGYSASPTDRLLIKNQSATLQNGVYVVTTLGAPNAPWVLTRADDYNSPTNINYTGTIPVLQGTTNANTGWNLNTQITAVGTSPITYTQAPGGSSGGPPGGSVKSCGNLPTNEVIIGAGGKTICNSGTLFSSVVLNTRSISTTSPITGGGDLSANRTFACPTCTVTSRAINTTSPITGGGDLSADRTIACATCTVTIGTGTIALTTSSIASATCSSASTLTITGVATTDVIDATLNADPTAKTGYLPATAGSLYIWIYPTTNTVNAKVCNNTSNPITPDPATVNVAVRR